MNEKTLINSIYPGLWAGVLQGLTVRQQCVRQATGTAWIGLEQNFIDIAVNEWRKHLLASVRIVGQHFKQFYYRQLKYGQLDKVSAKVSKNVNKICFYALC